MDPVMQALLAAVADCLEDGSPEERRQAADILRDLAQPDSEATVAMAAAVFRRAQRGADLRLLQAQQAEEEALEDEELDELEAEEGLPPGRIPLPESADVPQAMRDRYERPAYDQNEQDEQAWCVECRQVCGHAGHRHALGDHGEIVCEQCGVTLDETT